MRETVMRATHRLIDAGMTRPPIRAVFYVLMSELGLTKGSHYLTLLRKLGEWRDEGLVDYGIFSDDSGARSRPSTENEIAATIEYWHTVEPATLPSDGYLRALHVEHEALVGQFQEWCDGRGLLVSSSGQLRRENLWTAVQDWERMAAELGAEGILAYSLVDWDAGGDTIYDAHRRWFEQQAGLGLDRYGLTRDQLTRFGLDPTEDWQIDGVVGLDPAWWRAEVRRLLLPREPS